MPASDQGVKSGQRYQLVPRTLIFVTYGDSVLLIKGAPHKRLWAGLYNGIGGHVECGESILEAARRELGEETGLSGDDPWLVGIVTVDTGEDTGVCIFVFRVVLKEAIDKQPRLSPEGTLEWVSIDQLQELPTVEDLPLLLPRVLEREPGESPFMAAYAYDDQDRLLIRFT